LAPQLFHVYSNQRGTFLQANLLTLPKSCRHHPRQLPRRIRPQLSATYRAKPYPRLLTRNFCRLRLLFSQADNTATPKKRKGKLRPSSAKYRNSPQTAFIFSNKKQAATIVKYRKIKIIENNCCFFSGFYYLSFVARNKRH